MKTLLAASCLLASSLLFLGGCDMAGHDSHTSMWSNVTTAVAVLQPTTGNTAKGIITFTQMGDNVHATGTVTGLAPNSVHAFHIHEFGDASSDNGSAAGGHYNPENMAHGAPTAAAHHAGDLGNIQADSTGSAKVDNMILGITIAGMKDPIIGRGVVIHAKPDDMATQPTGAAGDRIAVGVIGIKKP